MNIKPSFDLARYGNYREALVCIARQLNLDPEDREVKSYIIAFDYDRRHGRQGNPDVQCLPLMQQLGAFAERLGKRFAVIV